jgi:S1-C subfamily serine protease
LLALALAGCVSSSGERAETIGDPHIAAAYLPLAASASLFNVGRGAAVIIGPNLAVTNAHNANLLDPKEIVGTSRDYDLLFFHVDNRTPAPAFGEPKPGEHVIAYGQGQGGQLRVAHGTVTALDAPVEPRCAGCGPQSAFTFAGDAGEGFSGGPVIDAETGRLVGILFGYTGDQNRTIYAYSMHRVETELAGVERRLPADVD